MPRFNSLFLKIFIAFLALLGLLYWEEPVTLLYPEKILSTDIGDDLSKSVLQSVREAKSSIWIFTYHCSYQKLIQLLNQKVKEGVEVHLIIDADTSQECLHKIDPKVHVTFRASMGLMHLKFIVLDEKLVWTGSANMTSDSLKKQSNMMILVEDENFAKEIISLGALFQQKMAHEAPVPLTGRKITLLPSPYAGPNKIISMLDTAKKTIRVAMFAFTRKDFAEALIRAKSRGVEVVVVLDPKMRRGVSKKVAALLTKNKVPLFVKKTPHLMHHKMALIDDQTLIYGSANWTLAAFSENDDYFIVLENLSPEQQEALHKIWAQLVAGSS